MKIKVRDKSYSELLSMKQEKHRHPRKQSPFFRALLCAFSGKEMKDVRLKVNEYGMERLQKNEPCFVLMNHSSFTDLQFVATYFKNRPYHIVCTRDGFVGKDSLMRALGCIPTNKFIPDMLLLRDMKHCFEGLHESVVMFPEASYSFDGTATPLPKTLGQCIRMMKVPVLMVRTHGSFLRDPLYNNLQKRKVTLTCDVKYLFSAEDTQNLSPEDINRILDTEFTFDAFREQKETNVRITEPFRADGLHRVLYQCPTCRSEGKMSGKGEFITCTSCGKKYHLREDGMLEAESGATEFPFVSDWYRWERNNVRGEIESGNYQMKMDVNILALAGTECMYHIGEGILKHNPNGFLLTGCDGALYFERKPPASYSLYADYFWYEIGDMISIGDNNIQYYCFPKDQASAIVAKARLATEELYKMQSKR